MRVVPREQHLGLGLLLGAYLFLDAMSQSTGGKPLPLGSPILR